MLTRWIRGSAFTAMALAVSCVAAVASAPTLHVIFADGGALEIAGYEIDGGRAILSLPGGGMIAVPASRILRVEDHRAPSREEDASTPVPAPGSPAAAPEGESAAGGVSRERLSARTVDSIIRETAVKYGLEPQLLAAVIAVESGYRSDAVSPKGAQGLMQLMPATARDLSVEDPFDPEQNIDGGARYLRQLLDQHGDSFVEALAAYNAGAGRVARYKGIPPYKETIDYIRRVLDQYESRLHR